MGEEVLVPPLEDVELGVVEFGVVVQGAVPLPDEATHARAALRGELAVEDDDDAFLWRGGDDGGPEEELLHLALQVKVQSPLNGGRPPPISSEEEKQQPQKKPRPP